MSEDQLVDEFSQTPEIKPLSTLESGVRVERRGARRKPPKTLEDAHAIVQAIAKRQVDSDERVKRWRFIKQVIYLLAVVGAFVLYFLIEKMTEALSLPSIWF